MTTYQPIKMTKGEDVVLNGTVLDQDDAAVDISGGAITMTVKTNRTDTHANALFTVAGASLAADGTYTLTITKANTNTLDLKSKHYDVFIVLSGSRQVLTRGKFILEPAKDVPA